MRLPAALGLPLETPRDFKVLNASINRFRVDPTQGKSGTPQLGRGRVALASGVLDELP
jgi:probable phosphoglycerate mutase